MIENKEETWKAILVCENCSKPTKHEYRERVKISDEDSLKDFYYVLIYGCTHCEDTRIWGTERIDTVH